MKPWNMLYIFQVIMVEKIWFYEALFTFLSPKILKVCHEASEKHINTLLLGFEFYFTRLSLSKHDLFLNLQRMGDKLVIPNISHEQYH